MASEDRPIIVNGGDQMITVTLPTSTKPNGGLHTLTTLPTSGPFEKIEITNLVTNKVEFSKSIEGTWRITIE